MAIDTACSCDACLDLPFHPQEALRVSYGMLLGEDDFHVLMGNPRGKHMLHSAWLHGCGVFWGFQVFRHGELILRVTPGLAQDGLGRELMSDVSTFVDLRCWLDDHDEPPNRDECRDRTLRTCLVARFGTCLSRPVPALADPCDETRRHDDPSRVVETVAVELLNCPCPPRPEPYHRVRVLLGLAEPGNTEADHEALEARERVASAAEAERSGALLHEFRMLAALDCAELRPAAEDGPDDLTRFPVLEADAAVPLACVEIDVHDADGCTTISDVRIDPSCRTALLPTATIQELTCAVAPALIGQVAVQDAGGPRIYAEGTIWSPEKRTVFLPVSAPVNPGSLRRATRITSLSTRGWVDEDIDAVRYDADRTGIVVELADRPINPKIRVIVRGTGPTPVYGLDPAVPLAGRWGGPPATADDGHDAVLTFDNNLAENGDVS
jgi:hypothetical protein